jgi:hypothetical protein
MSQIINRAVEVCKVCGTWDPFRKGPRGKSVFNQATQTRRIYGQCRKCGTKIIVIIRGAQS